MTAAELMQFAADRLVHVHGENPDVDYVRALRREADRLTQAETRVSSGSLTFAAFAAANRTRCEASAGFNHALASWSLSDWVTAVLGELGEAANVAKKLNRVRDGIPGNTRTEAELRAQLRQEIADTFVYLDLLAQSRGFALEDAVRAAFDIKSAEIGYPARLDPRAGPGPGA